MLIVTASRVSACQAPNLVRLALKSCFTVLCLSESILWVWTGEQISYKDRGKYLHVTQCVFYGPTSPVPFPTTLLMVSDFSYTSPCILSSPTMVSTAWNFHTLLSCIGQHPGLQRKSYHPWDSQAQGWVLSYLSLFWGLLGGTILFARVRKVSCT
jgi:hypothetical protein